MRWHLVLRRRDSQGEGGGGGSRHQPQLGKQCLFFAGRIWARERFNELRKGDGMCASSVVLLLLSSAVGG